VIPEGFRPFAKRKALEARRSATTIEKNRGRIDRRTLTTTTVGTDMSDWQGLWLFLKLEREVTVKGKTTKTVNYAVTSHSVASATPERLLGLWRDRWSIENGLFWEKDVVLGEDHSRIRTGLENVAAATRSNILRIDRLLSRLDIVN
jgi:predicted transposase YbfD/YdcC